MEPDQLPAAISSKLQPHRVILRQIGVDAGTACKIGLFRLSDDALTQAVGTSRDGRMSRIHAPADDRGRPVASVLTPGGVADFNLAAPIMQDLPHPKRLPADKALDADRLRTRLKRRASRPSCPPEGIE